VADPKRREYSCSSKGNELISTLHLLSLFAGESQMHEPLLLSTTQFLKISVWPAWRTCLSPLQSKNKEEVER